MTEVVRYVRPDAPAMNPATGELVALDSPTNELAQVRDELRTLEAAIRDFKAVIDRELVARFDDANEKSLRVGGYELKVDPPMEWVTDAKPLRDALLALVDKGHLSLRAVDDALSVVRSVKVNRVKLKALREHPDALVREAVEEHDRRLPVARRRVSVSVTR